MTKLLSELLWNSLNKVICSQLLLIVINSIHDFNIFDLRNQINKSLKKAEIKNLLMIKVSLFLIQNNIVLKTNTNSTAAQLLEKKAYWQHLFFLSDIKKDEKEFKVIAHNIFTKIFNNVEDMKLLKEEIKIYNLNFKLLCLLRLAVE